MEAQRSTAQEALQHRHFSRGHISRCGSFCVLEEDERFQRKSVGHQRIVFCASSLAADALRAGSLPESGALIIHRGNMNIQEDFCRLMDRHPNVHAFAQNCLVRDPQNKPLPIGLEDRWRHQNGVVRDFQKLRKKSIAKIPRIVSGFNLGTNPDERWPCYRALWRNPVGMAVPNGLNSRLYRKFVHPFMFTASPPGTVPTVIAPGRRCTWALCRLSNDQ